LYIIRIRKLQSERYVSVQVTEVSVHAVLDCSSVMQWMVVVKVREECDLSKCGILVSLLVVWE